MKREFKNAADGMARERAHPGHPPPQSLDRQGITTRDTLSWQERRSPPRPDPEPVPEGQDWSAAGEQAEDERLQRIAKRRARFEGKAAKMRDDLSLARDYREQGR